MGSWDQIKGYHMYEVKTKSQDVQDEARRRHLSYTPSYSSGAGDGFFGWGTGAEAFCGGAASFGREESLCGPRYCGCGGSTACGGGGCGGCSG